MEKDNRFNDLEKKIDDMLSNRGKIVNDNRNDNNKLKNLIYDFIGIILFSSFLGFNIDKYFDKAPIFLLICLLFGVISAIYLVYKNTSR